MIVDSFRRALNRSCAALVVAAALVSRMADGEENAPLASSDQLKRLSIEDILNVQIWSVSRKEERASDAAAAVHVITQEDIRRSGVTSIPEALRLAPGLQVARVTSHDWAISARGFNTTLANKLQVLIDGRSVYTPLFSGVFWDVQDTLLEDIERIEVIRGPGATLWGANAVNGVINIITRSAKDTLGTLVTAGGGTEEKVFGGVRYGGRIAEDVYYRAYVKGFDRDSLALEDGSSSREEWQQGQGGFRVDWDLSEVSALRFSGDAYLGRFPETRSILSPTPPFVTRSHQWTDVKGGNLLSRWTRTFSDSSDLQVQAYYDRTHRSIPRFFKEDRDTFDVDVQHRFRWLERQEIMWGGGYSVTRDDVENSYSVTWEPRRRTLDVFSAFVQDEITVVPDRLRVAIGSKFEHNDYTGMEIQPSGRFSYTPATNQTVWGAVSRAVRTPSRFDNDVIVRAPFGAPGGVAEILGSDDFLSEELLAFELGYRISPHEKVSVDIAAFYNIYDRLRSLELGSPSLVDGRLVFPVPYGNELEGITYGGETMLQYQMLEWWRWTAGYALLLKDLRLDSGSTDPTDGSAEGNDPTHQFSIRSFMNLPQGFELDSALRYVDSLPEPFVPSYLVMDVRFGWRPSPHWEFSLMAQNLVQTRHREFGSGPAAREIEHGIYGKVTWRH